MGLAGRFRRPVARCTCSPSPATRCSGATRCATVPSTLAACTLAWPCAIQARVWVSILAVAHRSGCCPNGSARAHSSFSASRCAVPRKHGVLTAAHCRQKGGGGGLRVESRVRCEVGRRVIEHELSGLAPPSAARRSAQAQRPAQTKHIFYHVYGSYGFIVRPVRPPSCRAVLFGLRGVVGVSSKHIFHVTPPHALQRVHMYSLHS